jgi:hypothetical protein
MVETGNAQILSPSSRILLNALMAAQVVKSFPASYGAPTVFMEACRWTYPAKAKAVPLHAMKVLGGGV